MIRELATRRARREMAARQDLRCRLGCRLGAVRATLARGLGADRARFGRFRRVLMRTGPMAVPAGAIEERGSPQ
jgi:hypothetical protein